MVGITIGDPTGIGPEVIIKSLSKLSKEQLRRVVLIGSIEVFKLWSEKYGIDIKFCVYPCGSTDSIPVVDIGIKVSTLDISEELASRISLYSIDKSIELLKENRIDSIVNAPISKERVAKVLPGFRGHTKYYAEAFGIENYNMAFYSRDLRVVLLTEHIPLKDVPNSISKEKIKSTLINSYNWVKMLEGKEEVRIGICGLNPHAGEKGEIGDEEKTIIKAMEELDLEVYGPLPPDTAFLEYRKKSLDCLVALYHDQGLIGFKLLHFDDGINTTIGLPFVRSSPDHGTAFDIAGRGIANPESMLQAIIYCLHVESKVKI
ncbi:MAG: 4-hydroxythreonine-4-phosphate dehydrogenase PdxA [Brevinematia bacterium]